MNPRNLTLWVVVLFVNASLITWGATRPITIERGKSSLWTQIWEQGKKAPSIVSNPESKSKKYKRPLFAAPAAIDPNKLMTQGQAEELVRISTCVRSADKIIPTLRRGIHVSPELLKDPDNVALGALRMLMAPDVPADFVWPQFQGKALAPVAQIRLSDVSCFDSESRLPQTGWLCFFYALDAKGDVNGYKPEHRGAGQVVYFGEASALKRASVPAGLKLEDAPCYLRFWPEWGLPQHFVDPDPLLNRSCAYFDLYGAMRGRVDEPSDSRMLGYAGEVGMAPSNIICEVLSQGKAFVPKAFLDQLSEEAREEGEKGKFEEMQEDAADWVLLLQAHVGGAQAMGFMVEIDPDKPRQEFPDYDVSGEILYFWIREADLSAKKFDRVWVVRQGLEDEDDE